MIGSVSVLCLDWYAECWCSGVSVLRGWAFFAELLPEPLADVAIAVALVAFMFSKVWAIILVTAVTNLPQNRPGPNAWPM